jgi:hypothetical protein
VTAKVINSLGLGVYNLAAPITTLSPTASGYLAAA